MNTEPIRMVVHGVAWHIWRLTCTIVVLLFMHLLWFLCISLQFHTYSCTFEHIQRLSDKFPPKNLYRQFEFNQSHISLAGKQIKTLEKSIFKCYIRNGTNFKIIDFCPVFYPANWISTYYFKKKTKSLAVNSLEKPHWRSGSKPFMLIHIPVAWH